MAFASDYISSSVPRQSGAASFFGKLVQSYKNYRVFKTTRDELQALSARDLADLGIGASDINRIAYEAAYK